MSDRNCYTLAAHYILENTGENVRLVHGIPTLTGGEHAGTPYGHAWIEAGDTVLDVVTGVMVGKDLYYTLGKIEYTVRYTRAEAQAKMAETGTYGAWDDKINAALHN